MLYEPNLIQKAENEFKENQYLEALKTYLELQTKRLDLQWTFSTQDEIRSICTTNDKEESIIVGSRDGNVYLLNKTGICLWKYPTKSRVKSVYCDDIDDDNEKEIIVGSTDGMVTVIDPNGVVKGEYNNGKDPIVAVSCGNLDYLNEKVILAGSHSGNLLILNKNCSLRQNYRIGKQIRAIYPFDINNDGKNEIITTSGNNLLIFDNKGDLNKPRSIQLNGWLYGLSVIDVDNDGLNEIVTCSNKGILYVLDRDEKWKFMADDSLYSICCADIDRDNNIEIVVGGGDYQLYILNYNGELEQKILLPNEVRAITHVNDSYLAVGLANSDVYFFKVIRKNEYIDRIQGCFNQLRKGQVDEIKLLKSYIDSQNRYLRAFGYDRLADFVTKREDVFQFLIDKIKSEDIHVKKACVRTFVKVLINNEDRGFKLFDILSDTNDRDLQEIIRRELNKIASVKSEISIKIYDYLVSRMKGWEDVSEDKNIFKEAKEKYSVGDYETALKSFSILKKKKVDFLWENKVNNPISSILCRDINQDGKKEIIIAADEEIYVYTHTLELKNRFKINNLSGPIWCGDIDGDNRCEIIGGSEDGLLYILDNEGNQKTRINLKTDEPIQSLCVLEEPEEHSKKVILGLKDGRVNTYEVKKKLWGGIFLEYLKRESHRFSNYALKLFAADIDNDGRKEIIIGCQDNNVYMVDDGKIPPLNDKVGWKIPLSDHVIFVYASDFDGDGELEIISVSKDGKVIILDQNGQVKQKGFYSKRIITDAWIRRGTPHKKDELIIASIGKSVYSFDYSGNKICEINLSTTPNSILCGDIDNDGYDELVIGCADGGIYIYKLVEKEEIETYITKCEERISKESKGFKHIPNPFNLDSLIVLQEIEQLLKQGNKRLILLEDILEVNKKINLLSQLASSLSNEKFLPIYIDTSDKELDIWTSSFPVNLSKRIIQALKIESLTSEGWFTDTTKELSVRFDNFIEEEIEPQLENKKLIIMIDIKKKDVSTDFFTKFLPHIVSRNDKVYWIIRCTSLKGLEEIPIKRVRELTEYKKIDFFNKEEIQKLFRGYLNNIDIAEAVFDKIYELTGGYPYLIQTVGYSLINYLNRLKKNNVAPDDLEQLTKEIQPLADDFLNSLWKEKTAIEKVGISTSADNQKTSIHDKILNFLIPPPYQFKSELFRLWVKEKYPLSKTILENIQALYTKIPLELFYEIDRELHNELRTEDELISFFQKISFKREKWSSIIQLSKRWAEAKNVTIDESNPSPLIAYLSDLLAVPIIDVKHHTKTNNLHYYKLDMRTFGVRMSKETLVIVVNKTKSNIFLDIVATIRSTGSENFISFVIFLKKPEMIKRFDTEFDIVFLDEDDIKGFLFSADFKQAFKEYMLRNVNLAILSPYQISPPATYSFYGRESEQRKILTNFGASYTIVGGRGVGKTSLLYKLKERLEKDSNVYYIDCSNFSDYNKFLARVRYQLGIKKTLELNNLAGYIKKISEKDKNITFLLDEVDKLLGYDERNGYQLFKLLRTLHMEQRCRFIIAGFVRLYYSTSRIASPFYNFTDNIELSYLDKKSARALVSEPMLSLGIDFDNFERNITELLYLSSRHPKHIQLFCDYLIKYLSEHESRKVSEIDILAVYNTTDFKRRVMDSFFENTDDIEKQIIESMLSHTIFSTLDVSRIISKSGLKLDYYELSRRLEKLRFAGILRKDGDTYSFLFPAFPILLKEEYKLINLLEDYKIEEEGE